MFGLFLAQQQQRGTGHVPLDGQFGLVQESWLIPGINLSRLVRELALEVAPGNRQRLFVQIAQFSGRNDNRAPVLHR